MGIGSVVRVRIAIVVHIAEVSPVRERRRGLPPVNGVFIQTLSLTYKIAGYSESYTKVNNDFVC